MIAARQIAFGKAAAKKEEPPAYWGLCFTAEEDGATIAMNAVGSAPAVTLETSYDGEAWEPFYVGETSITLNKGERVYFRAGEGGNLRTASSQSSFNNFSIADGLVSASGNIGSLLNGDSPNSVVPTYGHTSLFNGCTSLTHAPEFPATTLAESCYGSMFRGCTSLTHAPELPATTLSPRCYGSMFNDCTSLTHAPELPATILKNYCYESMFNGCTSLTHAPELPATTLAASCYRSMFNGCTSLTHAPELPATTLAESCYESMFNGCSNINFIKCSMTVFGYATSWVEGVSPTGTFVCPTSLGTNETIQRGASYCPEGWTVINED